MKAERRHDLKTNALARGLENMPEFARQYGGRILLGAILVVLAFVLYNNWRRGKEQTRNLLAESLTNARNVTALLERLSPPTRNEDADDFVSMRGQYSTQAEQFITTALDEAGDDPAVRAEALVAKGNLNWVLANLPEVPAATTRPKLAYGRGDKELLEAAERAYQDAVALKAEAPLASVTARLSLAAIEENRRDWKKAEEYYQSLIDDPSVPQAFRDEAVNRKELLKDLRKPVLLAPPTTRRAEGDEEEEEGPFEPEGPPAPREGASKPSTTRAAMKATAPATKEDSEQPAEKDAPTEPAETEKPEGTGGAPPAPPGEGKRDEPALPDLSR